MFGVLFDVSGSMKQAFSAHYDKRDALTDDKVKRSHGIITTLNNIVNQEITTYERKDLVFVSAFGLDTSTCEGINTCDFVSMLKNLQEIDQRRARWEEQYPHNGHRILTEFAIRKNAGKRAAPWIKETLTQKEAGILWEVLRDDDELTQKLIDLLPPEGTYDKYQTASNAGTGASNVGISGATVGMLGVMSFPIFIPIMAVILAVSGAVGTGGHVAKNEINKKVDNHEALTLARKSVEDKILKETKTILEKNQKLKPHPAKYVSNLLGSVLQENKEASSSRIHKIIDSLKPYIYGRTPMVKALREAKEIFDNSTDINPKVLFVLSDGCATDGDPTQEIQDSNVVVVTCYFTSYSIPNPKCLVDKEDPSWSKGARVLYHMSSTMANTKAPITHLIDYGWKLPLSGASRLFVQANSLDVVEEFCKVAVSQLTHGVDALVHMLGRVSLATYINQSKEDFKAQQQIGATCYANAIAAVFHLTMHRIVDREGGIPEFRTIRGRIIREYGKEGANTEMVVAKVCPEYRLQCLKVNEAGARQAINERLPVIARFSWKGKQQEMFKEFYKRSPKAILSANDIAVKGTAT